MTYRTRENNSSDRFITKDIMKDIGEEPDEEMHRRGVWEEARSSAPAPQHLQRFTHLEALRGILMVASSSRHT